MTKTMPAVELEAMHEAAIAAKREKLTKLNDELSEMARDVDALRAEFLLTNPTKPTGGVGMPVTEALRKLEKKSRERDLLEQDLKAQENLLSDFRVRADEERQAKELAEAEAAIAEAEGSSAALWGQFEAGCEAVAELWNELVDVMTHLDSLPAGDSPLKIEYEEDLPDFRDRIPNRAKGAPNGAMRPVGPEPGKRLVTRTPPFPSTLLEGFSTALGHEMDGRRFVGRRIATTSGNGATDTTGYARDLHSLGDFR